MALGLRKQIVMSMGDLRSGLKYGGEHIDIQAHELEILCCECRVHGPISMIVTHILDVKHPSLSQAVLSPKHYTR